MSDSEEVKEYAVDLIFEGSTTMIVEASSPEEAAEKALEEAPMNDFAHAEYDPGEWMVMTYQYGERKGQQAIELVEEP